MALDRILHNFSSMLVTCRQHVSRVAQCLSEKVSCRLSKRNKRHRKVIRKVSTKEGQEKAVWRNTILMGVKCRPLNFSGAIHYDSDGRQTPTPRSPMSNPLPHLAHTEKVEWIQLNMKQYIICFLFALSFFFFFSFFFLLFSLLSSLFCFVRWITACLYGCWHV